MYPGLFPKYPFRHDRIFSHTGMSWDDPRRASIDALHEQSERTWVPRKPEDTLVFLQYKTNLA